MTMEQQTLSNTVLNPLLSLSVPMKSPDNIQQVSVEPVSWALDPALWENPKTLNEVRKCTVDCPKCKPNTLGRNGVSLLVSADMEPGYAYLPCKRLWFCSIECLIYSYAASDNMSPSEMH